MSIPLYILKRILVSIPTIIIVSIIGFTLMRYDFTIGPVDLPTGGGRAIHLLDEIHVKNPINPLAAIQTNPAFTAAALEHEKKRLGLDKPMFVQYGLWARHLLAFHPEELLRGNPAGFFTPDLGKTFTGDDVWEVLMSRAGNTLILNLTVLALTWLIALPLGIWAALRWRSLGDRLMTVFAAVGMSFPSFVLALMMAVFAVKTDLFPLGGVRSDGFENLNPLQQVLDIAHHIALPALVLFVGGLSSIQRQMRGNLLEVLGAEYVRMARAKGLPENTVIYKHAVRTAINPLITLMGYEFSALLGGAILVETVLGFPGLGQLTYRAALETDTNLMMATLLMSSIMLVAGNLLADILLKIVDPRIELD